MCGFIFLNDILRMERNQVSDNQIREFMKVLKNLMGKEEEV